MGELDEERARVALEGDSDAEALEPVEVGEAQPYGPIIGALLRLWGGRRKALAALGCLADELHDRPHGHSGKNKPQAHLAIRLHGSLAMVMLNDRKSQADVSVKAARADELVGIYDGSVNVIDHGRQSWFR